MADLVELDLLLEQHNKLMDIARTRLSKLTGTGLDVRRARLQFQILHGVQVELIEERNALRERITMGFLDEVMTVH